MLFALVVVAAMLVSGCGVLRPDEPLNVDLRAAIPSYWRPIDNLREVNIDGDADVEYILFYHYDDGSARDSGNRVNGPVGAVIFDLQIDSGNVLGPEPKELVPIPNQPSAFYVPHRILPNYWPATGNRFYAVPGASFFPVGYYIAEPEDAANIRIEEVQRAEPIPDEEGEDVVAEEMIIYGGATHITIAWWENSFDSYGVAHLHAPGGFRDFKPPEAVRTSPIESVQGAFPLHDRSRLCRNFLYTRDKDDENVVKAPNTTKTAVRYVVSELGLDFCDNTPDHPFYPEGVVLAYLLDSDRRGDWILPKDNDDTIAKARARIDRAINFGKIASDTERVQNLRTASIISYPPRAEGGVEYNLETTVCVELVSADNVRRQLDFILRYFSPSLNSPYQTGDIKSDKMYVVDVAAQKMLEDDSTCWDRIVKEPPAADEFPVSEE